MLSMAFICFLTIFCVLNYYTCRSQLFNFHYIQGRILEISLMNTEFVGQLIDSCGMEGFALPPRKGLYCLRSRMVRRITVSGLNFQRKQELLCFVNAIFVMLNH